MHGTIDATSAALGILPEKHPHSGEDLGRLEPTKIGVCRRVPGQERLLADHEVGMSNAGRDPISDLIV